MLTQVRCDAASLGVPCTNCVAFSIECKIPAPRRKKTQGKGKDGERHVSTYHPQSTLSPTLTNIPSEQGDNPQETESQREPSPRAPELSTDENGNLRDAKNDALFDIQPSDGTTAQGNQAKDPKGGYAQNMKPKFVRAPIKEAGRVAYLGESSNLSLLVHDRNGTTDVVHYPLPENLRGARARMNDLDNTEIDILHTRGAFLLPPRGLCDELVDAFFTWIAPVVPVVNRSRFMRRYRDSKNPPSLLLLQAILLAGSRVCKNPQLMDSNGSTTPAAMTFYKRAKALFDANYEDDRVTVVQAAILMGWYWEGPEDVTRNVFFWSRVALVVAQGSGMHRSVESSQLSRADKRLLKRIWWTLFTRDRSVAVALGRPCGVNTEDSDVEMLTEDDFNEDEADKPAEYQPDRTHVLFFLNYVKLAEIMGLVLSQQYSVASKTKKHSALDLTHADMALADWLQNCPKEVFWERPRHHFWSALLHANYYTTLCLLHRAHMPPAGMPATTIQNGMVVETAYPSRNIAYQAAGMITSIVESLQAHDQLRFAPAFIVYSLFSALIMHIYQLRSSNAAIVSATEQRMDTCMEALKEVSKVWLVAKMVHTLFESIVGNKTLEERLQKAAGRKHVKPKQHKQQPRAQGNGTDAGTKRKYEEVDEPFGNGTPSAQMSYERSRPQTPSGPRENGNQQTPTMAPPQQQQQHTSPNMPRNDAFMGNSRNVTRQTTPFNPGGQSYPSTPPDLYLVTRNSPSISHDIWNNFEPTQLFPDNTNLTMPNLSPSQQHSFIDSAMTGNSVPNNGAGNPIQQAASMSQTQFAMHPHPGQMQQSSDGQPPGSAGTMMPQAQHQDAAQWAQLHAMNHGQGQVPQSSAQDETMSNSSSGQPIAPTTLNVEDWFQFFGINGNNPVSFAA